MLDTLLGAAPVGFGMVDTELRYVRVNPTLAAITARAWCNATAAASGTSRAPPAGPPSTSPCPTSPDDPHGLRPSRKDVQDRRPRAVVYCAHGGLHAPPRAMNELLGLVGFAFVGSVTPGPNNTLLWASGLRFGLGRTAGHVVGTALGMGVLILAMAGGVGALLEAVPGAELGLKLVGSAYLLYLAFRIASSNLTGRADISRPLGVLGGAAFQFANPKAWLFALAAVGTFLPPHLAPVVAALTVAVTSGVVILGSATLWAAGGAALNRIAEDQRAQRAISLALAVVLAASVAFIWI